MKVVYLDHHATTPCDPRVVEAMLPYFTEHFGNAASTQHTYGLRASVAVEAARAQVAALIGGEPHGVVFTSGATEADNLAILGVAEACARPGHLITSAIEHAAVLDPVRHLATRGWDVTILEPDADGRVTAEQVAAALRDDTVLVSVMAANNEIGTLQPIAEIGALCRSRGVLFHTDAVQAAGRVPLDVRAMGIDLLSLSAHKMYGPKGVGALWFRRTGRPRVSLSPRMLGGGHEHGLRSGTLPVPLLVGFGRAAELAAEDLRAGEPDRLRALRDALWAGLADLPGAVRNGSWEHRLPNNLNVSFPGVRSDALLARLRHHVAVSAASACTTAHGHGSHVLAALGLDPARIEGAIRFGLGRSTTADDVEAAVRAVRAAVAELTAPDPAARAGATA